ncbi:MAG: DUF3048 domain-containing protein [Clostridia bacterium]|nr:DUF3048 domain-containing protein [Clostridia bacterium]
MKKLLPVILVLCLMLCSCGGGTEETTAPIEETTNSTDVVYRNPLNGEVLPEPYSGRVFAVTINNVSPALPHKGINSADLYFEMFINDYCTRGLALFSNIKEAAAVGSIRSTRYNFTDICLAYNSVLFHANCSDAVLQDMISSGIDNLSADGAIGYRDSSRSAAGYDFEHTLFATGESLYNAAADKGFALSVADKNYGMNFSEEATPAGEEANEIEIVFTLDGRTKTSTMKYNAETDSYNYYQYGKEMIDENDGNPEAFKNVIVMFTHTWNDGVYHVADLGGSGDGFFACGGKIVPIKWTHMNETDPFTFTLTDGTPLVQEVGSTYIAIAPIGSAVNY